jgi:hypothetical protein
MHLIREDERVIAGARITSALDPNPGAMPQEPNGQ